MTACGALDRTDLSWWFPRLVAAGVPVPRTIIIPMPEMAKQAICAVFDGDDPMADHREALAGFHALIAQAGDALGWPCFLRTGHTSGKHGWSRTCFLPSAGQIAQHVCAIVEYSEMASLFGLPWDTWAVREMLPTVSLGTCQGYGGMPICREFRFFVRDGEVLCRHPYWPRQALLDGDADPSLDHAALCRIDDEEGLSRLASAAGAAVGGAWSVDLLETKHGWFVTDMAEAEKSYHWPGCHVADGMGEAS